MSNSIKAIHYPVHWEPPGFAGTTGLVFQSRRFRQASRDYRLRQEFITPYTPEQDGMIERFF